MDALALISPADARSRAFLAARRHSRLVRALRRVLELGILAGVVGVVALIALRNFGGALRDVSFEGVGIEGGRITMDKPRLSGSRPNGGAYNITAVKAMQDARHPGDVDLALIGGDISMPDREVSRLSANSGHYESAAETLDLAGDVQLATSRYEVFLQSVKIAFRRGEYVSNEPVKVHILPDAEITADAFKVRDGGGVVVFEGHVRTRLNGRMAAAPAP